MKTYRISRPFLLIATLFFVITTLISLAFDKTQIHITINSYHHPFADYFFKYVTYLGDGFLFVPVIVYFTYLKNFKKSLFFSFVAVLTLLVTGLSKSLIFPNIDRPLSVIGAEHLHLVEGVKIHTKYSFPSGHTTAAFAFWASLSVFFDRRTGILFCAIAILVALSRVYLSQHFLVDVAAGTFLGILIALFGIRFLNFLNKKNEKTY
ncbi:phosphatase PAP2 family protein [Schleiferia thermophila]|uniref:Membrane-associated phospholipid phosphatase n=1 Tax=Schleiferia thermophila TaxID=884107 RepID=A0A368ZVP3_9FLAO|nr:phosphatase PAP2 family protein [Schleiferia thermophila]RCX01082.1 membrane-associated phospholipid phosphatase [Schleiferia thermophila]GCD80880.1 hypothetical protein JCM30197_21270 [Schleiferia thermophila]